MKCTSIKPGEVWLDTNGNPIQAHAGSVFYEDGVYYWYGENKEKTTGNGEYASWGIRCYTSMDLYNWEDKGLIIPPDLQDESSPLSPSSIVERPHIIYNKVTKKYVCWIKSISKDWKNSGFLVLTADGILGPYTMTNVVSPGGFDFDLCVSDDGKGYLYYGRSWDAVVCVELTSDYTDVTDVHSVFGQVEIPQPPFSREAPAHFSRNGKHYVITSGTTGYFPNPSQVDVADAWHGPYTTLENPHPEDESNTSFHSQVSSVFKVDGKKDLYIACADRWVPEYMDVPYEFHKGDVAARYGSGDENGDKYFQKVCEQSAKESGKPIEEVVEFYSNIRRKFRRPYSSFNTSISRYVWLPIRFDENGNAYIDWKDDWKIEDYENDK